MDEIFNHVRKKFDLITEGSPRGLNKKKEKLAKKKGGGVRITKSPNVHKESHDFAKKEKKRLG